MNKIKIFICDLSNKEQVEGLEAKVSEIKDMYHKVKVTWNQSSASASGGGFSGIPEFKAQHVLSAVVEWDDSPSTVEMASTSPKAKGTPSLAWRSGFGSARR